jgi:DNA-binding transcriptional regulator PaaX
MSRQNIQTMIMRLVSMAKSIPEDQLIDQVTRALADLDTGERKVKPEYVIKRTLKRLEETGSVQKIPDTPHGDIISLTGTGNEKLHRASVTHSASLQTSVWDGKWRIVILDFESDDKKARDAVRYMLKKTNFLCLKQSVWITPHNLDGFVSEMKYHMKLTSEVMFLVAESLDKELETEVKEYFGISA